MQLIDEIYIKAKAGKGGNGVVRWRQEKFIDKGGPTGGNGGKGGDVYFKAIRDPYSLARYKRDVLHTAKNGAEGEGARKTGKSGEDIILELPIGSVITNITSGMVWELKKEGEKVLVLYGGQGGLGNNYFKSSLNTTPEKATPGKKGDEATFQVVLSLFADIGLIGLPNAGKSSMLNALTNSRAKTGEYAFTTLDPNLGDFHGYILADIPGLIEGASEGKGLGVKFLKHITHTDMLAHLVSCEHGEDIYERYTQIRNELQKYGKGLSKKDEVIVLTKTDMIDAKELESLIQQFEKMNKVVFTVSLYDDESVKDFMDKFIKILRKNK
ncbi:MAG: GTPase ObgE [Candidatus Pacebacteria bacterium]|nr:GTPase ObgE [Candidatus Paceibacterota bacterium]